MLTLNSKQIRYLKCGYIPDHPKLIEMQKYVSKITARFIKHEQYTYEKKERRPKRFYNSIIEMSNRILFKNMSNGEEWRI